MTPPPARTAPRPSPLHGVAPHLPPALDLEQATVGLDRRLALAFRPMHKLAFGVAVGLATGLLLFALAIAPLGLDPEGRVSLRWLASVFVGYGVGWRGALVGLGWGLAVGAVAGWFAAFVRNLVLAVWLLSLRVRANLSASREFLDHI